MKKVQDLLKLKPELEKLNLSLMQIETINDLVFEIFHFQNLKELDLSGNRIKTLPKELSILKTVQRLDISNNLFKDIESVLTSLSTMPALIELNMTYDLATLSRPVSFYLPKLEVLNGEVVRSGGEAKMENPIVVVNNGKVNINNSKSSKTALQNGFMIFDEELANLRNFQQNIQNTIQSEMNNPKFQNNEFRDLVADLDGRVKDAYNFNEYLLEKATSGELQKNVDLYEEKLAYFKNLVQQYNAFLRTRSKGLAACNENMFTMIYILLDNLKRQGPHLQKDAMNPKYSMASMKPLEQNEEEGETEGNNQYEQIPSSSESTLLRLKVKELERELRELKEENADIYKSLINDAKKDVLSYTKKINTLKTTNKIETMVFTKKDKKQVLLLKGYNLRKIDELIYDIMNQKAQYDQKCIEKRQCIITVENYLFIYFSKKYGLKDLVMVEISSVIERINSFANQSQEVEVFRRIVKNELDEKFFWLLQNIKQKMKDNLVTYYKEKVRKAATLHEANNFAVSRMNNQISKKEGNFLLSINYSGKEQKKMIAAFAEFFDLNAGNDNEVEYFLFIDFIFKHETEKHVNFLRYVSQFFNGTDRDKNGMITRKQFLQLLDIFVQRRVNCDPDQLISEVDPAGANAITFSKTIEVLGSNFADREKKVNLIQFLNSV